MKDSQSAAPLSSTQSECFSTHYFGFMACNFTALVHIHPSHQHHFRLQRASVYNEKALRKKKTHSRQTEVSDFGEHSVNAGFGIFLQFTTAEEQDS